MREDKIAKIFSHQRLIVLGALGGTRTPTILLTATSRQRVYQFRHERFGDAGLRLEACRINGADLTNPSEGYKPAKATNSTSLERKFRPSEPPYRVPGPLP